MQNEAKFMKACKTEKRNPQAERRMRCTNIIHQKGFSLIYRDLTPDKSTANYCNAGCDLQKVCKLSQYRPLTGGLDA
jgi:hypothetical protein